MSRTARLLLPSVCLLAGLLPSAASAALPEFTHAEAKRALADARRALAPEASAAEAARATPALRDLAVALPALDGAAERRAERILARPDDKKDDEYFGKEADGSPICNVQFCVHFSSDKRSAPASDRFLAEVVTALDTTFAVENVELGWRAPKGDGTRGARDGVGAEGQTDVYINNLGKRLYGYAAPDPGQEGSRRFAYLVLDNNYVGFPSPPLESMQATVAHEYNHILQFGYDTLQDIWLFEASATWAEQKVYPQINDYLIFIPSFAKHPELPLIGKKKVYGDAVLQHWLESRYGPELIEDEWQLSAKTKPKHDGASAVDDAIEANGGRSFSREFAGLAAASAEWRSLDDFPDSERYPDVKRRGKLTEKRSELELDKTAYELTNVTNPGGAVKLRVEAPRGVPSAIALIGRRGSPRGGEVTIESRFLSAGRIGEREARERGRLRAGDRGGDQRRRQQGRAPTGRAARLPRQADEVGPLRREPLRPGSR